MGIDAIFKEHAGDSVVADINSIDREIRDHCAADEESADHAAGGEQGGFSEELRHNAAPLHADGGEDADLALALEHRHDEGVGDDGGSDAQHDQVQHDHKCAGIILELSDEFILVLPGERLVERRL